MGDSVENFDGHEIADIRRIALGVIGERGAPGTTPGGRAPVKGVAETRARFDAHQRQAPGLGAIRAKAENLKARHLNVLQRHGLVTQLTPDRPGSMRLDFLSLGRRVGKMPLLGRAEISQTQEWIRATGRAGALGIKGAALAAAWSVIPEPIGGIAQAGIVGGMIGGPIGAAGFAAVAGVKGAIAFMGRRAREEESARARTRGYRSPEAMIEQHGLVMRIALLEAKIAGAVSATGRAFEVEPDAWKRRWREAFTFDPEGTKFDPITGKMKSEVRADRERDIAEWQQLPVNAHPGAQWALKQMQEDLEGQLLGVTDPTTPGQRLPTGRVEALMNRAGLEYDGVKSPATTGS